MPTWIELRSVVVNATPEQWLAAVVGALVMAVLIAGCTLIEDWLFG